MIEELLRLTVIGPAFWLVVPPWSKLALFSNTNCEAEVVFIAFVTVTVLPDWTVNVPEPFIVIVFATASAVEISTTLPSPITTLVAAVGTTFSAQFPVTCHNVFTLPVQLASGEIVVDNSIAEPQVPVTTA